MLAKIAVRSRRGWSMQLAVVSPEQSSRKFCTKLNRCINNYDRGDRLSHCHPAAAASPCPSVTISSAPHQLYRDVWFHSNRVQTEPQACEAWRRGSVDILTRLRTGRPPNRGSSIGVDIHFFFSDRFLKPTTHLHLIPT